jgi:hypothetical protein
MSMSELTANGPYVGLEGAELELSWLGRFQLSLNSGKGDTLIVSADRSFPTVCSFAMAVM